MFPHAMNFLGSFMNLAGPDLIIILLIVLVLFGAKKLPELARGMGQAVKEFQKAKDEISDELNKANQPEPKVQQAQSTVPRLDSPPPPAAPAPPLDPNQTINPAKPADQA